MEAWGPHTIIAKYKAEFRCMQVAGVQYVLDTVIYALLADPNRKFAYAEMVRRLSST